MVDENMKNYLSLAQSQTVPLRCIRAIIQGSQVSCKNLAEKIRSSKSYDYAVNVKLYQIGVQPLFCLI